MNKALLVIYVQLGVFMRKAFSQGYKNTLVGDGHSTLDSDILTAEQIVARHNKVLGSQYTELKSAAEIVF